MAIVKPGDKKFIVHIILSVRFTFSIRIISVITTVNVSQKSAGSFSTYGFSQLDATDRKCRTYTKVCCGPKRSLPLESTSAIPLSISTTAPVWTVTKPPPVTTKKPCSDKFRVRNVASLPDLVLYGATKDDVECPENDIDDILTPNCKKWEESGVATVAKAVVLRNDCNENENGNGNLERKGKEIPFTWIPKCGRHNPEGFQQSVINLDQNLHESQFAEWPNMCAVLYSVTISNTSIFVYRAGASLISPKFLLTAAHSVNQSEHFVRSVTVL